MENEIWLPVKNYELAYEVSNIGRVRSLDRTRKALNNSIAKVKGQMLVPGRAKSGYFTVALCKDGKRRTYTVHQLVAIAFMDHVPNGINDIVDHKDNDKENNRIDNLQIITQRSNATKDQFRYSRNSQYVGVCWHIGKNKWYASLSVKGKSHHLGAYINEYDAHLAYQRKLKEIQDANI